MPAQPPLKVCPRCAVASRTGSESCPACGRRYKRRYWPAVAVAVTAAAFAAGYGGHLLLADDDDGDPTEITAAQAQSVPLGISSRQFAKRLEGASPVTTLPDGRQRCLYYAIAGRPDDAWAFCFRRGKLVSSVLQSASAGG